MFYQKKSRFHLELDTKLQTEEDVYKTKRKRIVEFIIDETQIKVGSELVWLWVIIELESKEILAISISKERNMFVVAERFLSKVIEEYGPHPVSTDGGT